MGLTNVKSGYYSAVVQHIAPSKRRDHCCVVVRVSIPRTTIVMGHRDTAHSTRYGEWTSQFASFEAVIGLYRQGQRMTVRVNEKGKVNPQ